MVNPGNNRNLKPGSGYPELLPRVIERCLALALLWFVICVIVYFIGGALLGPSVENVFNSIGGHQPLPPLPTTYTVVIWCQECADIRMSINVWEKAGTTRGSVVYSVPYSTTITVLSSKTADDGRRWYRVSYLGKTGWIPSSFVK